MVGSSTDEVAVSELHGACCLECEAPKAKYYSIDHIFGHCGECCMDPAHYWGFKLLEPGLMPAGNKTCADFGYPVYESTVTHGVGKVSMTLDLYDKKPEEHEHTKGQEPVAPEPQGACCMECEAPKAKYYSIDHIFGHCGECCMDPAHY